MAISSASGFSIGSSDAIDDRLVLTKAQMKSANDNVFPDVYMCVCSDDGNIYTYNKTNTVDETTGKFRIFESGGGLPEPESKDKLLLSSENETTSELEWKQVDKSEVGSIEFVGTKAEWEALSTEEKAKYDGKKLNFTDSEGENLIDDTAPANNKVYSSSKVEELFDKYTEMTWTPASDVANGGNICGFVVHNVAHIYGWVTPTKKGTNQVFYTCTNFKAVKTLHITNWEGNISTVETTEFPCASYNGGLANGRINGSDIIIHIQEDFVGKNLAFNFTALVEPIQ